MAEESVHIDTRSLESWRTSTVGRVHKEAISAGGCEWQRNLGRGQYGVVHLVTGPHGEAVAKLVFLEDMSEKDRALCLQEVEVLRRLKHPNVVRHLDSWLHSEGPSGSMECSPVSTLTSWNCSSSLPRSGKTKAPEVLVNVMEYCAGGDLRQILAARAQADEYLAEDMVLGLFSQVLMGIGYVHQQNILHRDLKTSNLFLDAEHRTVKIGDFGIARVLESTAAVALTTLGTPYYMSPEVCKGDPYRDKSDMWSLGCVLYEMCMFKRAFESQSLLGLVYRIVSESYDPLPPQRYGPPLNDLLSRLLAKAVDDRPTAQQALDSEAMRPYGIVANAGAALLPLGPEQQLVFARDTELSISGISPSTRRTLDPRPPLSPPPPRSIVFAELHARTQSVNGSPSREEPSHILPTPPPLMRPAPPPGQRCRDPSPAAVSPQSGFCPGVNASPVKPSNRSYAAEALLVRCRSGLLRRPRACGSWLHAFAIHDKSGQGTLSCDEFMSFLSSLRLGLSAAEVRTVAEHLAGGTSAVTLGAFSDAVAHASVTDVRFGEEWAARQTLALGVSQPGGLASLAGQGKDCLASLAERADADRVRAWLPKTFDGSIDWKFAEDWCSTASRAGVAGELSTKA